MKDRAGSTRAATGMVVGAIVSVQCGAALATTLFDSTGSAGSVFLRSVFGASALLIMARNSLGPFPRGRLIDIIGFAAILAGMNLCFYAALERLPLGITVTLEFVGPLGIAVLGSRRPRDLLWAALAAIGIVLLSGGVDGSGIDALGAVLALSAGGFWAAYILQSARLGRGYPGLGGLAVATAISAALVAPLGIADAGGELLSPGNLAIGVALGVLSTAIPYALEMEALRRLPKAVFGVLMSLEPAVAALVGFVALSQGLSLIEAVAIGLVVAASAGALRSASTPAPRDA